MSGVRGAQKVTESGRFAFHSANDREGVVIADWQVLSCQMQKQTVRRLDSLWFKDFLNGKHEGRGDLKGER